MREISLHIMDIIQNSVSAKAMLINLDIIEDTREDRFEAVIKDNGIGMSKEMLENVKDPFVTSRKTRRVGLGLSLFEAACKRCEGYLKINSEEGKGTTVTAFMKLSHIDRMPLGKIQDTIVSTLVIPGIDIVYSHKVDDRYFNFDSREVKKLTGSNLNQPEILIWIRECIMKNIEEIGGGV